MNQEKIANLIKELRKENNLTQKDLGDSLGVSAQAVSKWENGKNIPDIALLKEISDKYNVDINNLLDGENIKKKKTNNKVHYIVITLASVLLVIVFILFITKGDFNSKSISSSCKEFKIQGILSYNSNKSSIAISNIEYCGEKNEEKYDPLKCTLYEKNNKGDNIVTKCEEKGNVTLEDFLNGLSFNITNYSQSCKKYESGVLRLEIVGTKNKVEEKFTVPLSLDEKCEGE